MIPFLVRFGDSEQNYEAKSSLEIFIADKSNNLLKKRSDAAMGIRKKGLTREHFEL